MAATGIRRSFILGSGSASRKAILTQAGYGFEVIKPDIDESVIGDRTNSAKAAELVLLLASAKADAIIPKIPDRLKGEVLLTADQVSQFSIPFSTLFCFDILRMKSLSL
jgi:septum formation protein